MRPDSWLRISEWLWSPLLMPATPDSANTSAKSSTPASAGSNRLVEFKVLPEPLLAVAAAKVRVGSGSA